MKKWSRHLLAAGALALGMSAAHADDNNTLYFYNWTEYVPPGLLEQFTKETGIKVIYSTYESNETMYAKLKTYKTVPMTWWFLQPITSIKCVKRDDPEIDKSKLTNFSNLDPDMLNKPFDPNNDYSIPYIWVRRRLVLTVMRWIRICHQLGQSVEARVQRQPAVDRRCP